MLVLLVQYRTERVKLMCYYVIALCSRSNVICIVQVSKGCNHIPLGQIIISQMEAEFCMLNPCLGLFLF